MAVSTTVAMYTGRSSEPRPQLSLLSQEHHGAELSFLSIQLSGYGGYTLKFNRLDHSANRVHNSPID